MNIFNDFLEIEGSLDYAWEGTSGVWHGGIP